MKTEFKSIKKEQITKLSWGKYSQVSLQKCFYKYIYSFKGDQNFTLFAKTERNIGICKG